MPPAERRTLLLLLTLAVAGQAVRHFATRPGEPPGQIQILATLPPGSPGAQRDSAMQQSRPLAAGEQVDVDIAAAAELSRLPKIGPRLAKIIVADRTTHGPFGSLAGLDRVAGIGPALLKLIAPHVRFSGTARQSDPASLGSSAGGAPCTGSTAPSTGCPAVPLNLNTATSAELDALPGIGPRKAAAILQYRVEQGAFSSVDELSRVPGFGPAAVSRLRERLAVR